MSARPRTRYSYRDYLAIPEGRPERHEVVDGELRVTAAPRFRHQQVVRNVLRVLDGALGDRGELVPGPVTVRLGEELVLEPDVVFVASERLSLVDPEGAIHGPPDLVVEVLSPATRDYDRDLKRKRYLESGVGEVWTVDADAERLEIWEPGVDAPLVPATRVRRVIARAEVDFEVAEVLGRR